MKKRKMEGEKTKMIQAKITKTFKDLIKQERWSPGKGEPGEKNKDQSPKKSPVKSKTRKKQSPKREMRKSPNPRTDPSVRTPTVLRTKIKRLESGMKGIESGSPRRKGRLTAESGAGKISSIIEMLRERGLEDSTKSLPTTRRQATAGNTSGLRAPKPAREVKMTSKLPGPKAKEGRESSGKKVEKEKRSQTSFLRKWLMDSGGTIDSGKRDSGGDSEARERERVLRQNREGSRERERD